MPDQVTHEEAVVPSAALTQIADADGIVRETSLDDKEATAVLDLLKRRQANRSGDRYDMILTLDEWAHADWSDYEIANSGVILVGHVEDYSDKAYKIRGGFEVEMGVIESRSLEEIEDEYVTTLISQIDNTDEDWIDRIASAFIPKSAVESILVYDGEA